MFGYVNGVPVVGGQARIGSLGLGNNDKQVQIRTSTNPQIGNVTTRILPQTDNIFNGMRSTLPALGAGSPVNVNNADVADRVLNSSLNRNSGPHDLRRYRGLSLASGSFNDPYNTDVAYGSIYAYSTQYPNGIMPANGGRVYPIGSRFNDPAYDLYGLSQNTTINGLPIIPLDADRGFNIDPNRGSNCKYIRGDFPSADRGFTIDPCTGYTVDPYRGYLANSSGGNINDPFGGLSYNPETGGPLGRNPCGKDATVYGFGSTIGSTIYQNAPFGVSACRESYDPIFPTLYGVNGANPSASQEIFGIGSQIGQPNYVNRIVRQNYHSPFSYQAAGGGCKSCAVI